MITLHNVTLRFGARILLKDVNWTIYHKQRIGLIGANGSGKTTLFSYLLKAFEADQGDIDIPPQLRFASVAQETPASYQNAVDFVLDADEELRHWQQALDKAEKQHDGERIAVIHEKLLLIDAYSAPARAAQLLAGLGFPHAAQQKSVSDFSGGWRVRLNLARALFCPSDVLLLDEPTNHLDLDAVLWLEQWLTRYQGTLVLISHDRDFLDHTVDHIAFLHHQTLSLYAGNYSSFETQHANELMVQQATYEKQQKQIAHMRAFVDRFRYKANKAAQAQSRLKAIERMDLVCAVQAESPFHFQFKQPAHCPNPLIYLERASIAYDDKPILARLNLSISPGERITLLGPNGAGKSSLIKLLAGEISPKEGERVESSQLKIGYFAQHQIDKLELSSSSIDHLKHLAPDTPDLTLRNYLGGFGFSGDKVFDPVSQFSGGEKSRLALALLVWQKPNLLLLDEPTNHLDLEMRQALSIALQEYAGALILVTHDRFLVRTTTDKLLLVANGQLTVFDGDVDDYHQWLVKYRKEQKKDDGMRNEATTLSKKEERQLQAIQRDKKRPLLDKIKRLENDMLKLEKELADVELMLADLTLYQAENKEKLRDLIQKQAQLKTGLEKIEDAWLKATAERDG